MLTLSVAVVNTRRMQKQSQDHTPPIEGARLAMAQSTPGSELQREMEQAGSATKCLAKVKGRFDHPDLVADPAGHQ